MMQLLDELHLIMCSLQASNLISDCQETTHCIVMLTLGRLFTAVGDNRHYPAVQQYSAEA